VQLLAVTAVRGVRFTSSRSPIQLFTASTFGNLRERSNLPTAVAWQDSTADGGREAHGAEGRSTSRVHNVVSRQVPQSAVSPNELRVGQELVAPERVGPQFVIDKCQAQKFVAEHVVATPSLSAKPALQSDASARAQ